MALKRDLQKPEESVRRPAILDDTVLLNELDNDLREILAEIDPVTIVDTLNGVVSQIRQILYGVRNLPADRWSDVPAIGLVDILSTVADPWGLSEWTAGEAIEKGRVLYAGPEEDTVYLASNNNLLHSGVIGIAYESKALGERIKVANNGRTIEGFSGLIPGKRYFLDQNGVISPNNPSPARGTYTLRAGFGKTNTALLVDIGEPRVRP